jgi:arylformamidase
MLDYAKGDRLALSSYALGAHTGTHVDAPLHLIKGGTAVDKVTLDRFVGPARVIDCSADATVIDAVELNKHDGANLFRVRDAATRAAAPASLAYRGTRLAQLRSSLPASFE